MKEEKYTLKFRNGWKIETFEDEEDVGILFSRKKVSKKLPSAQDIIDEIKEVEK